MVYGLSLEGKAPLAGEQRPGGVRLGGRLAERRTTRSARPAAAAAWDEHQHHVIADDEVGHPVADGAKREAQTFARSQMERMMAGMNVVAREEFEAVKEMAAKARDENEKLAARVAALEAKLGEPRP